MGPCCQTSWMILSVKTCDETRVVVVVFLMFIGFHRWFSGVSDWPGGAKGYVFEAAQQCGSSVLLAAEVDTEKWPTLQSYIFLEGRMMIWCIEIIFMVNISSIIIIIIIIINNNNSNKLFGFTHSPHQPVLAAAAPCVPGDSENASCLHVTKWQIVALYCGGAGEGIEIETLHGHTW